MSGLLHRSDQVTDDIIALGCHQCEARYSGDQLNEILSFEELQCLETDCHAGGMIPYRNARIDERFPAPLSERFTPLPEALMDYKRETKPDGRHEVRLVNDLGLGPNDLLVIWALEWHRRVTGDAVFPRQRVIATMTRLSARTVKRTLDKLVKNNLIVRESHYREDDGQTSNRYNLDPLWECLATPLSHRHPPVPDRPGGSESPPFDLDDCPFDIGGPCHTDTHPPVTVTHHEVDVGVEGDVVLEVDPIGTSPAQLPEPEPLHAVDEPAPDLAVEEDTSTSEEDAEEDPVAADFTAWQAAHPEVAGTKAWRTFQAGRQAAETASKLRRAA